MHYQERVAVATGATNQTSINLHYQRSSNEAADLAVHVLVVEESIAFNMARSESRRMMWEKVKAAAGGWKSTGFNALCTTVMEKAHEDALEQELLPCRPRAVGQTINSCSCVTTSIWLVKLASGKQLRWLRYMIRRRDHAGRLGQPIGQARQQHSLSCHARIGEKVCIAFTVFDAAFGDGLISRRCRLKGTGIVLSEMLTAQKQCEHTALYPQFWQAQLVSDISGWPRPWMDRR
eukprot:352990-Chlamydomonas_euryale.AAC.1